MILFISHSGKDKNIRMKNRSVVARNLLWKVSNREFEREDGAYQNS